MKTREQFFNAANKSSVSLILKSNVVLRLGFGTEPFLSRTRTQTQNRTVRQLTFTHRSPDSAMLESDATLTDAARAARCIVGQFGSVAGIGSELDRGL